MGSKGGNPRLFCFLSLVLSIPFFSMESLASRLPTADPKGPAAVAPKNYMPQADAFETASEQAVFLSFYQMSLGPYGKAQDPEKRKKLLEETASAIQDCLRNQSCGQEKQQKVLKALVQYNMGKELQRMMLTNSTNREKMRSLEDVRQLGFRNAALKSNAADQAALARGKDTAIQVLPSATKITPKTKRFRISKNSPVQIGRGFGSAKEPYYSLKEDEVKESIIPEELEEKKIFGESFFREFGPVMNHQSNEEKQRKRYYKFVQARENAYQYANPGNGDASGDHPKDSLRMRQDETEQKNAKVKEIFEEYKKEVGKITLSDQSHGGKKAYRVDGRGANELGIGEIQWEAIEAEARNNKKFKIDDLKKDGKFSREAEYKAVTRWVNLQIQEAAQKKLSEQNRSPAGASPKEKASTVAVTLSPETFGKFLDEIWPPSQKRN